jgi:hypothetical protein
MKPESELRQTFPAMVRAVHIARGALRLLRPHAIDRAVAEHVDRLAETEAVARLLRHRGERDSLTKEIRTEKLTAFQRAASVGLFRMREVQRYVQEFREWVQATRRDVRLSFPDALNGVDRNGMIMLGIAREQVRARLAKAPASELLDTYRSAQPRKDDPIALLETEAIESLLDSGARAASETDLPVLKKLRALVTDWQDWRLPTDLPDYESLAADVDHVLTRASAAQISVINPAHDVEAGAVYKSQEAALLAAGTVSDRDDMQAVQKELAMASGE